RRYQLPLSEGQRQDRLESIGDRAGPLKKIPTSPSIRARRRLAGIEFLNEFAHDHPLTYHRTRPSPDGRANISIFSRAAVQRRTSVTVAHVRGLFRHLSPRPVTTINCEVWSAHGAAVPQL